MIPVIDENLIYEWAKNEHNNFRKSSCFDSITYRYNYILTLTANQLTISVIFSMHEICVNDNLKCLKTNMYINNNVNEKDFVLYLVL